MSKYSNVTYDNPSQANLKNRRQLHWAREEYINKLSKYSKYNPEALIYSDMELIEKTLSEIVSKGDFYVGNGRVVKGVKIDYAVNNIGFVRLETVQIRAII